MPNQLHNNSLDYIYQAIKTESIDFEAIKARLSNEKTLRILHAIIGLSTEVGELEDALKKHIFYGKELDEVNLMEECGDLFWYLAILHNVFGKGFEYNMKKNIAKLKARYGDKFNEEGALNRKLDIERNILEGEK